MANTSKQAKRAAASKAKKKQANVQRQKKFEDLGRRDAATDNKMLAKLGNTKYREMTKAEQLANGDGYGEAVKRFRKMSRKDKDSIKEFELTNKQVLSDIDAFIGPLTRLHAGIDVFETLVAEKRFGITAEQQALFEGFDSRMMQVVEDIFGIYQFMEADKQPDDYMVLYTHMGNVLLEIAEEFQDQIIGILETQKEAIDQYATEHRGNTPIFDYQRQLHELRMLKIGPKYATQREEAKAPLHAYTPDNPQPLDPIDEPASYAELADEQVGEPLTVEPDLIKDVETAEQPQ